METHDKLLEGLDHVLAARGQIAIFWRVADVLEIRPDLTPEQAWQVLQEIKRDHASGMGINWSTLDYVATQLFGEEPQERLA